MSTAIVIDFTPEGSAQAMHKDGFSLDFLGDRTITRASEIQFNEKTQLWDIWLYRVNGNPWLGANASNFSGYDTARKVEVKWLEDCRLEGVDPMSERGNDILAYARIDLKS